MLLDTAKLTGGAILLLYVLTVVLVATYFPLANWDMLAYVATVLELNGVAGDQIHGSAYDLVRTHITDDQFRGLTADRAYRIHQYQEPDAFQSMLFFYRVKLFYVHFAHSLTALVDPVQALRIINQLCAVATGGIVLWWLQVKRSLNFAPMAVVLLVITGFGQLSRLTTPDLFSALFVVAGLLLFVERREVASGVALFLACLARPDHLALVVMLFLVANLIKVRSLGVTFAFAGGLLLFLVLASFTDHPGWWTQMWFTHVEYVPTMEGFEPEFSVFLYVKILLQSFVRSLVEDGWLAVLGLELFALVSLLRNNFRFETREGAVVAALLFTIAAKFVVFPLHETRFHFAYLLPIGLILLAVYAREVKPIFSSRPVQA